jgi:hypothetical protein
VRRSLRKWPGVLALALALGAPTFGAPARDPSAPLGNEEVVRLVMNGRPEAEILRIIAEAEKVDFDLDPEVVTELRRVGVSEAILSAMRARQAAATPPPASPAPEAPIARGTVEVEFSPAAESSAPDKPAVFQVIRKTPRWAAQQMGALERTELEDLALFLACATPEHVPDHWSDRTPLKDFSRHEMLSFRAGSRPGKAKGFEVLVLDLSSPLAAEVPEGTHRLVIGIAAKTGPDWHVLQSARPPDAGVEVEAGKVTRIRVKVSGRIVGSQMTGFKEEQDFKVASVSPPEPKP